MLPNTELDEKTLAFAHRLAAGPTRAYDVTNQLLLIYREQGVAAADSPTARACAPLFETDDLEHGIESLRQGPGGASFHER